MTGHDAHFALARGDDSRAVPTQESGDSVRLQAVRNLGHVGDGDTFGDQCNEGHTCGFALKDGVSGKGRWNEDDRCVGTGGLDCLFYRVKDWLAEKLLAAFAGCHSSDDIGSVVDHLLGMESAFFSGDSANDDLGVFIDED